ncbi:MAG: tandem-95 repeat protein [Actinobacteria bacterium]|nr:tandem-95 repeat protein [Actinomycetota bacterium]
MAPTRRPRRAISIPALAVGLAVPLVAVLQHGGAVSAADEPPVLAAVATYDTGLGANGAEIIGVRSDRAVVSNAIDGSIDVLDVSDPLSPTLVQRIKRSELTGLTSVAIHPTKDLFVAVAGASAPARFGRLLVFRLSDGALLNDVVVATDAASTNGRQPDSVEFSPNGDTAVIAIEAEQVSLADDGGNGAIAVADFTGFDPAAPGTVSVATVEFPNINAVTGVSTGRTHGDAATPIDNAPGTIEPEGVGFSPDGLTAYVTLQENNAVARLDLGSPLPAVLPVANVFGLGTISFLTDTVTSGGYLPTNSFTAFHEPDGIRVVEIAGTRYLVVADEGDTRNAAGGNSVRGGRTLSIFDATTGTFVSSVQDGLNAVAARNGLYPDARSNRAGVEPEMIDVTTVNGRVLAAVSLERAGAVAMVDISTPTAPIVTGLVRTGDNPEGVKLISRDGQLFAYTANEVSGTVTASTIPVGPLAASYRYVEDTPRSFGLAMIDDNVVVSTLDLVVTPASAGTLSGPGLAAGVAPGEYRATGNTDTLNDVITTLRFTPAANSSTTATVTATVSDGVNPSTVGTITFVGTAVDDAPVADAQAVTTAEDTPVGVTLTATDIDGGPATYAVLTPPTNGALSGVAPNLTYTPNANVSGPDSFTFTVTDGTATSQAAVSIDVTAVEDRPTIVAPGNQTTPEDTPIGPLSVTLGDVDTDPAALTFTATSSNQAVLADANISLAGTGAARTITLSPNANASGTTTVTLTANDGTSQPTTATFTLTVTPVNDAPTALPDTVTIRRNSVAAIAVLANDTDIDGGALRVSSVTRPRNGAVVNLIVGVVYVPRAGFTGMDTFTYTVSDGRGGTATATVTVNVTR